ncbi:HNH endonuclease signature motif containing protein [Alloactinosynnema sp. L-07]|uniref:HNH endonuclease signature motif containing protein n=1 Tax=Alloactinosynnema sp. L-07 TaxID=1653480 RepID=UPI0012FC62F9|nr:HNH endonuclease signature motif containing protein [Alloactinosynnema sp. L-07]
MFSAEVIAEMSDVETLDLLRELERRQAALDAAKVRALAHMARLRPDLDAGGHRFAGAEVGAALTWTPAQAATQVTRAVRLTTLFPTTVDALATGRIDLARAHALAEITATLSDEHAREVETWILARHEHKTIAGWRQALRAKKDRIDPDGADRRRELRRRERRVDLYVAEDGMAHFDVYDTGERLRAVYLVVDKMARTMRAHGSPETLDTLRADALYDLVVHGGGRGVTVELQVAVPYTVLLGANLGGTLDGYGSVPNITIRELISEHDTHWRRILTDPVGKVLEVSTRRHPGADLTRHIRLRDQTCRFPGCHRPAVSCELDHTIPHSHGGTTSAPNLGCLCLFHHKLKDQPGWRLKQTRPGLFIWTTPTGETHTVDQEPLIHYDDTPAPRQRDTRQLATVREEPAPF